MSGTALWIIIGLVVLMFLIVSIIKIIYALKAGFVSCVTALASLVGAVIVKEFFAGSLNLVVEGYIDAEGTFVPTVTVLTTETLSILVTGTLIGMAICVIGILGLEFFANENP